VLKGGINLYGYVGNNSTTDNDPTGRFSPGKIPGIIKSVIKKLLGNAKVLGDYDLCALYREKPTASPLGNGMIRHYCYYWCDSGYRFMTWHDDCYKTDTCKWFDWVLILGKDDKSMYYPTKTGIKDMWDYKGGFY